MSIQLCETASPVVYCFADVFESLDGGDIKTIVMFGVGGAIAIIAILTSMIRSIAITKAREATKREMAAYVAEGTVKPEDAVAMLNAGKDKEGKCC